MHVRSQDCMHFVRHFRMCIIDDVKKLFETYSYFWEIWVASPPGKPLKVLHFFHQISVPKNVLDNHVGP